jgi:cardiolipin synthase
MLERGWSTTSLLMFIRDSVAESTAQVKARRSAAVSIVRFSVVFYAVTVTAAVPVYIAHSGVVLLARFASYAALGTVGFTAFAVSMVGLLNERGVGLANYLTVARFLLIVPVLVLFAHGLYAASLVWYAALGLTDVADGPIARRRGERSEYGVIMDPLADVFSTAAVFAVFLAHGLIPGWLFLILIARYAMLIIGSVALFLAVGPIHFRSTTPGKVVGVIQAAGVAVLIVCVLAARAGGNEHDWLGAVTPVLFPVLGVAFASIIVSQALIGLRHIRSAGEVVDVGP